MALKLYYKVQFDVKLTKLNCDVITVTLQKMYCKCITLKLVKSISHCKFKFVL